MRAIVAIAVIFHIVLVIGVALGWFDDYYHGSHHTEKPGLDLHAMYDAGQSLLKGGEIYHPPPYDDYPPFRYLPIAALPGMLLSMLEFNTAYILWFILLEFVFLICIQQLRFFILDDDDFRVALCMYLFFTPFYIELFMGQYSMIQSAFILMFLTHYYMGKHPVSHSHWVAAGLWKLNTFLAIPAFIKFKKYKPVIWGIGIAALSLIVYSIFVPGNMKLFFGINFRAPAIYQEGNLGLRMLWDSIILHVIQLGHPMEGGGSYELSTGGKFLSLALPVIILGLCFQATKRAKAGMFADLACLWITAYFLLYTDIWEHHYLMLLPILVMQYTRKKWKMILLCYLFIAAPTTFALFGDIPIIYLPDAEGAPVLWNILLHHATKPIPTLVFFLMLWRHILITQPEFDRYNLPELQQKAVDGWDKYTRRTYR